jgi:hypothetical protein
MYRLMEASKSGASVAWAEIAKNQCKQQAKMARRKPRII